MIRRKKADTKVLKYDPYKLFRQLQSLFLQYNMNLLFSNIDCHRSMIMIFELADCYPNLNLNEQVDVMLIKIYEERFQFDAGPSEDSLEKRKVLAAVCENMIKWIIVNNKIHVDRSMSVRDFIEHSMEM